MEDPAKTHIPCTVREMTVFLFILVLKWPDPNLTEVNEETLTGITMGFGLDIY